MLKKETKIFFLLFQLIILGSCSNDNSSLKSNQYVKSSIYNYSKTYNTINDSINNYIDSTLKTFQSEYIYDWQVDSMICINSRNDKLVAVILSSSGVGKGMAGDAVLKMLGKKIKNKWYFFSGGGTLIIPRDMYGKSEMNPLTFHELSQIARKELLESALIKNEKGEYIVDDKWIDNHFYYNGMCAHCKTQEQYDSTHWYKIIHKWSEKIDTNEFKPLRKNSSAL